MKINITIGMENFILTENEKGYAIKEINNKTVHEVCRFGELNETIYRMIDRLCTAMV